MRLEDIASEFGEGVSLRWRSFLLRPEPSARSLDRFRRYTQSWTRPASVEPRALLRPWASDSPPPTHSVPAAVAAKAVAAISPDVFPRYHRALLSAYFTEHRDISDRIVLADVAAETGLDRDDFDATLTRRGRELQAAVIAEHAEALDRGIYAAPTVVIDGDAVITGAVDTDHYRRVIVARGG